MEFKKNPATNLFENTFNIDGINFRFIQKKSRNLGIVVYFRNGKNAESFYDENGNFMENSYGLAHFIEHLLFSSATEKIDWLKRLVSEKIAMNGATGENVVFYHINAKLDKMLDEHIESLLKIAYTLDIDDAIFEKEKGIVSTEASLSLDAPYNKMVDVFSNYIKNSHTNHSVVGTPESVMGTTKEEVIKYYTDVYTFENSEICIYADFEGNDNLDQKVIDLILEKIENIRAKFDVHAQLTGPKRTIALPNKTVFDQKTYDIFSPKTTVETSYRFYRFPMIEDSAVNDYETITFLNTLLHPQFNPNVKELFEKYGFRNDTGYYFDLSSSSKTECSFYIEISEIDRVEELVDFVKEIFGNIEKYITSDVIESIKTMEVEKQYRSLDETLENSLLVYPYKFLRDIQIIDRDIPLDFKVDIDVACNVDVIKNIVGRMDFENYLNFIERTQDHKN